MIRLNNFFLSKQNDKEHREHINYALALGNTLSSLEAEAHESDDLECYHKNRVSQCKEIW